MNSENLFSLLSTMEHTGGGRGGSLGCLCILLVLKYFLLYWSRWNKLQILWGQVFMRLLFWFSPSAYFYRVSIAMTRKVKNFGGLTPSRRGETNQKVVRIGKILDLHPKTHLFFHLWSHINPKKTSRGWRHIVHELRVEPGSSGQSAQVITACTNQFCRGGETIKIGCRFTLRLTFFYEKGNSTTPLTSRTFSTSQG